MKKRCAECRHWERDHQSMGGAPRQKGECRIRAPKLLGLGEVRSWPRTGEHDWCSEFRAEAKGPTIAEQRMAGSPPMERDLAQEVDAMAEAKAAEKGLRPKLLGHGL